MTFHIVIACPHCKRALGVREDRRTATCPRCGRELECRSARAYHRTEDMAELARLVGEMNARLEHGFKRYERDARAARGAKGLPEVPPGLVAVAARVANTRGRRGQLESAVGLLCAREGGAFSSDELLAVLSSAGWPEDAVVSALEGMVREGALVEPRPDSFMRA